MALEVLLTTVGWLALMLFVIYVAYRTMEREQ